MKNLFEEFRHAEGSQAKKLIVDSTLREFEVYATLEEEIFYPSPEHQTDEKGSRAGWREMVYIHGMGVQQRSGSTREERRKAQAGL